MESVLEYLLREIWCIKNHNAVEMGEGESGEPLQGMRVAVSTNRETIVSALFSSRRVSRSMASEPGEIGGRYLGFGGGGFGTPVVS